MSVSLGLQLLHSVLRHKEEDWRPLNDIWVFPGPQHQMHQAPLYPVNKPKLVRVVCYSVQLRRICGKNSVVAGSYKVNAERHSPPFQHMGQRADLPNTDAATYSIFHLKLLHFWYLNDWVVHGWSQMVMLSGSQMVMLCPHVNRHRTYTTLFSAISPTNYFTCTDPFFHLLYQDTWIWSRSFNSFY